MFLCAKIEKTKNIHPKTLNFSYLCPVNRLFYEIQTAFNSSLVRLGMQGCRPVARRHTCQQLVC